MEYLFLDFLNSLKYDDLADRYKVIRKRDQLINELGGFDIEFEKLGYDPEQIKQIKAEYTDIWTKGVNR